MLSAEPVARHQCVSAFPRCPIASGRRANVHATLTQPSSCLIARLLTTASCIVCWPQILEKSHFLTRALISSRSHRHSTIQDISMASQPPSRRSSSSTTLNGTMASVRRSRRCYVIQDSEDLADTEAESLPHIPSTDDARVRSVLDGVDFTIADPRLQAQHLVLATSDGVEEQALSSPSVPPV